MSKQNSIDAVDRADIVIVGNGIAGLTAAVEARRLEPEKSVVIVTSQSHPTINTPSLKQFAIGKLTREQLLAYPAGTERIQRIHLVNAFAEEIHAQEGYLRLSSGQGFGYDSLLLTTGSRPTGLPADMPGQDFDGVMTLHRLYDYLDLRRRLNEVEEAVVIGGGAHAIETVMGMLYLGIRVHWLIRSDTFMPRTLDHPASDMVLDSIRRAGAKVYTETEVVGIVGRVGAVAGVVTTTQQMLPCQLVLVCTGTAPVTTLAQHCDLPMKYDRSGILVDDQLRTSARNIYAAGDVASLRDPLTGKYAARPQWYAAVLQGRAAAATITGSGELESFGVPWHATRLGDLSMLTVGNPLAWPETVEPLTEKRKGSYCLLSLVDDRLVGYLSLGSMPPDSLAIKRIIDEGLSVRDITRDLLRGEFDARKYFSRKRTYAAQRMITTGQLPTPLPPMPGIIAGERRSARISAQLPAPSRAQPQRSDTAARISAQLPVASRAQPQRGETAARLNTPQPSRTPRMEPQRGETAARLNALPPGMPRMDPQRGETAARFNAQPPGMPKMAPLEGKTEAWVNDPPQMPRGRENMGWLNASPPPIVSRVQPQPGEMPPRVQYPATEPLVRPVRTGSRSVTGPRPPIRQTGEQRRQIAEQKRQVAEQRTLISEEAGFEPRPRAGKTKEEAVERVTRVPDRQFIAPPRAQTRTQPEEAGNPHPSRSLWHYTDKHPAVKGRKHVQE